MKEVMFLFGTRFKGLDSYHIYKRKRVIAFVKDEIVIQIGKQHFWLRFCIELVCYSVLGIHVSEERNLFVTEKFIRSRVS
ncbi:MAG: hypothetical protein ACE5SW_13355 [Nitrososphaeraceae archaeon]